MSGDQTKCPACDVSERVEGTHRIYTCTGRAGCVRTELREAEEAMRRGEHPTTGPATEPHPDRETPAPESDPAGPCVPDGKADIVEQDDPDVTTAAIEAVRGVERGELMAHLGPRVVVLPREEHDRYHEIVVQQRAEIAHLRAENERLVTSLACWPEECGDRYIDQMARIDALEADRSALAKRVAEAVREAVMDRLLHEALGLRSNGSIAYAQMAEAYVGTVGWIDLGPIVAAMLAAGRLDQGDTP